jgi:hypothetical protein
MSAKRTSQFEFILEPNGIIRIKQLEPSPGEVTIHRDDLRVFVAMLTEAVRKSEISDTRQLP